MEHTHHPLSELFEQLGLESGHDAIEHFISSHSLPENIELANAPFWSQPQASFLKEEWHADSDWAEVIDQLNIRLR
ncbi:DUF2789 domain-containing protein [Oceanisphaera avium]|uniref:DUF2789 domain-containing protein n=1 Tax=Oceanisphaera avium TaxID=1903694 RepID=A0A1Y0CWN0_9GAMM|nr:DUF2789 domain-containing protein [Oceanisphaera avium]ART79638.1 hypothetical protein CBP12_05290 [Oceanisphaera avium]